MMNVHNTDACDMAGADPGYVKRGAEIQKGGPGGWYNPKIAQK